MSRELGPCSALGYCSFRGRCHWKLDEGATCTCDEGYEGEDCSQQVYEENLIVEEKKMEDIQEKTADIKDDDAYVKKMIDGGNEKKSEEDEQKMAALWNLDSKDDDVYGNKSTEGDETMSGKKSEDDEQKATALWNLDNKDADNGKKMNDQGDLDNKVAEKKIVYGDGIMSGKNGEDREKKMNDQWNLDSKDADNGKKITTNGKMQVVRGWRIFNDGDEERSSFLKGSNAPAKEVKAKEQDGNHPFAAKKSCTRKPPPPNVRENVLKLDQRMRKDKHGMNRKLLPNDWDITRYDTTRYDATLKDVMRTDQQQKEGTVSGSTGNVNARMITLFGSGIFIGILFGLVVFILYKMVLAFQTNRGEGHRSFNNEAYEEEAEETPEEILIEV